MGKGKGKGAGRPKGVTDKTRRSDGRWDGKRRGTSGGALVGKTMNDVPSVTSFFSKSTEAADELHDDDDDSGGRGSADGGTTGPHTGSAVGNAPAEVAVEAPHAPSADAEVLPAVTADHGLAEDSVAAAGAEHGMEGVDEGAEASQPEGEPAGEEASCPVPSHPDGSQAILDAVVPKL